MTNPKQDAESSKREALRAERHSSLVERLSSTLHMEPKQVEDWLRRLYLLNLHTVQFERRRKEVVAWIASDYHMTPRNVHYWENQLSKEGWFEEEEAKGLYPK